MMYSHKQEAVATGLKDSLDLREANDIFCHECAWVSKDYMIDVSQQSHFSVLLQYLAEGDRQHK